MSFRSAHRDIHLVVVAKAVSWLGDEVATLALMLRLQDNGHGAIAVAALLVANALPIVLLSGAVGQLADRFDNRRLLVLSSLAQAAVCTVLAGVSSAGLALVLVALLGVGQAVNGATWQALLGTLAEGDGLTRAIGRSQAARTGAGIVAPALSGVLVGLYGAGLPLLLDAATYLVVTLASVLIATERVVTPQAAGEKRRGGVAIVRSDTLLRPLFVLLGLFVLLASLVNVVDVFLIRSTLGASTTSYGFVGAAMSAGALAGALLSQRLHGPVALARGFVGTCAGLAISLVAIGLSPSVGWALGFSVVLGLTNGSLNVTLSSLVIGRATAAERGRVGALLSGVASGTQILAFAVGGGLAGAFTPREIFVGTGALGLLVPLALGRGVLRAAAAPVAPVTLTPVAA